MAVSTNYSSNPDLASIAKRAFRLAGLQGPDDTPTPAEVQQAAEFLNDGLKGWQTAERFLRHVDKGVTQTLTAGTASYTAAADTIDVEFPANVVIGTVDYAVDRMTLEEYVRISNKAQTGIPSQMLVERKDTVILTLWPVPDATVTTLKYTRSRLIRDLDPGTTVDLQQRYLRAVILMVAVDLAESYNKSDDKIARLTARFEQAKDDIHRDNAERGDIQFALGRW